MRVDTRLMNQELSLEGIAGVFWLTVIISQDQSVELLPPLAKSRQFFQQGPRTFSSEEKFDSLKSDGILAKLIRAVNPKGVADLWGQHC